ncbi:hypothetical protein ABZ807_22320 [Micromonospora sp. NPDC047548]|uniref:hypothetical protein n=1 Tax=Micromonospora sp. NPDC047548 TaxID=3155624 RepID=UPI003404DFFA
MLGRVKLAGGVAGIARLHAILGEHLGEDDEDAMVLVGPLAAQGVVDGGADGLDGRRE